MVPGLNEKRAIVTGAANGIGRATASALHEAGVRVVGLDIAVPSVAPYEVIKADVSDQASVQNAVAAAIKTLGLVDIVVNSAGIEIQSPLADLDMASFDRMYAVNVRGTALVVKAALPHLNDNARIINLASELAFLGRAGSSAYCATKGAILSLTKAWAREFAPKITVNSVAPGPINTSLLDYEHMTEQQQALETDNPLRRIGQPEEVADMILFLAGSASFITGQCFSVDGGAAMR
jgi:3-oxoacyl-[acyl-carrier protein] reductase